MREKISEAQQKLRKEYKATGMTEEQILEMYEYATRFTGGHDSFFRAPLPGRGINLPRDKRL